MHGVAKSSSSDPLLPAAVGTTNNRRRSPQHGPFTPPQVENEMLHENLHANTPYDHGYTYEQQPHNLSSRGNEIRERSTAYDAHRRNDVAVPMMDGDHLSNSLENNFNNLEPYQSAKVTIDKHNRCCKGKFWCIADCCGIVCAIFTWLLMLYSEFVVVRVILMPYFGSLYTIVNMLLFQTFGMLAFTSHIKAMLTDPGAVPRGNATKENIQRMGFKEGEVIFKCTKCCSIKPDRAHHCSVCQRCIRKMDHHCPWVNNCVGERNQKYFVLFTLYIALMSFHALFMALNHFIGCIGSDWKDCPAFSPPATIIFLLFLMFEGLLFALFTSIMFGTQVSAIWYDETGIESLKKEEATWARKSRWKSIQAVFGRFSIQWFSPFADVPKPSKSKGYMFSV